MTSLTVNHIHRIIDQVLQSTELPTEQAETSTKPSASSSSFEWRRVVPTQGDWETIDNAYKVKFGNSLPTLVSPLAHKIPFYFGIQASRRQIGDEDPILLAAFCTFYLAYSTWDGRMLNVDQFLILEKNDWSSEKVLALYQILAKIAVQLQCIRLTWKVGGSLHYCYAWYDYHT
jgi:hypothetical protein